VDGGITMASISWKSKEQIDQEQLEVKIQKLREQRNKLLQETDWLLLRHQDEVSMERTTTLSTEQHQELLAYRQALRDLPESWDINNPIFPDKPSF
jgi:type III secretory pathway component EscV